MSDQSSHGTFRSDIQKRPTRRPGEIAPKQKPTKELAPNQKRSLLDYLPPSLSDEQKTHMRKAGDRIRKYQQISRLPMICMGMQCPFYAYCELVEKNVELPIGNPCPVEDYATDVFLDDFKEHYALDDQDPQSFWILNMMRDLAAEVIVSTRVNASLALDPAPMEKSFGGITFGGQAIEVSKLKATLDYMIRLNTKKMKLIKEMLGTPKSKAEAGRLGVDDPSSSTSDAQARATKLRQLAQAGVGPDALPDAPEKPALPTPQVQRLDVTLENRQPQPVPKPEDEQ